MLCRLRRFASAAVVALGAALGPAAQPALELPLEWEPVGHWPFDSEVAPSLGPDGTLWYGGLGGLYPHGGVLRLRPPYDSTAVWDRVPLVYNGTERFPAWAHLVGPDTLLASSDDLYRSTDGGATWAPVADDDRYSARQVVAVPWGLPHGGRLFIADGPALGTYSDDRGATWHDVPRSFDDGTPTVADSAGIQRVAVVTAGPHAGRLVGAGDWGLNVSDDGGRTWAKTGEWAYFGQTAGCVAALRGRAPGGGDRLVAVVNDARIPDDSVRVALSDDGGGTWRRVGALIPGAFRACVEAVDLGGGRAAVVMMRGPVYGTEDGGETWSEWSGGPPLDAGEGDRSRWGWVGPDGRLYVSAFRNGPEPAWDVRTTRPVAWWAPTAGEGGRPKPSAEGVGLRVAPNPTGGAATVALRLAAPGRVRVAVYDVRGREVAVVHDGPASDGARLAVATAGWGPGVYLVRATGERGSATAPLVVGR